MTKTPEQVIAKLQRRLANTGAHTIGLIDSMEGWRKQAKSMEDVLAYVWRQLSPLRNEANEIKNAVEAIEHRIPSRIRKEQEKDVHTSPTE